MWQTTDHAMKKCRERLVICAARTTPTKCQFKAEEVESIQKTDFSTSWHHQIIKGQIFMVMGKPLRHFISLNSNVGFRAI